MVRLEASMTKLAEARVTVYVIHVSIYNCFVRFRKASTGMSMRVGVILMREKLESLNKH